MTQARMGFQAIRGAGIDPVLQTFQVDTVQGTAIAIGDPVRLTTRGTVALVTASTSSLIVGVVEGVGQIAQNGAFRPFTFSQPNAGPYAQSSVTAFVKVNINPMQRYLVSFDATASTGMLGKSVVCSVAAPNTRTGISGYSVTGPGTKSDSAFKIVGLSPYDSALTQGDRPPPSGVVVIINPACNFFMTNQTV